MASKITRLICSIYLLIFTIIFQPDSSDAHEIGITCLGLGKNECVSSIQDDIIRNHGDPVDRALHIREMIRMLLKSNKRQDAEIVAKAYDYRMLATDIRASDFLGNTKQVNKDQIAREQQEIAEEFAFDSFRRGEVDEAKRTIKEIADSLAMLQECPLVNGPIKRFGDKLLSVGMYESAVSLAKANFSSGCKGDQEFFVFALLLFHAESSPAGQPEFRDQGKLIFAESIAGKKGIAIMSAFMADEKYSRSDEVACQYATLSHKVATESFGSPKEYSLHLVWLSKILAGRGFISDSRYLMGNLPDNAVFLANKEKVEIIWSSIPEKNGDCINKP